MSLHIHVILKENSNVNSINFCLLNSFKVFVNKPLYLKSIEFMKLYSWNFTWKCQNFRLVVYCEYLFFRVLFFCVLKCKAQNSDIIGDIINR